MTTALRISTGIAWNFLEVLSRRGLASLLTLALAYFISPQEFGLVAIVTVFIAVGSALMESGLKDALIRAPSPNQDEYNTVFYATLCLGIFSSALLFALSSAIGNFFNEGKLPLLVRVTAIGIVLSALQVVPSAILHRRLDFKSLFSIGVPANTFSALIAIGLAFAGAGIWALIAHMLISTGLATALLWRLRLWRPEISFHPNAFWRLFNFGWPLFLSALIQIAFANSYVILLAKVIAAATAGLYFFTEKLRDMLVTQLVNSIQTVTYPALSALQTDMRKLKQSYRAVTLIAAFVVFPIMFFLAVIAEPLFMVVLPKTWWPAHTYFQWLCLAGVLYPLHAINLNILKVVGRSDLFLRLEIMKAVITACILLLGLRFGVLGILIGQVVGSVVAYIPNSYYSRTLIDYSATEQIKDVVPTLLLSALVALIVNIGIWAIDLPMVWELLISGVLWLGLYSIGTVTFNLTGYALSRDVFLKNGRNTEAVGQ